MGHNLKHFLHFVSVAIIVGTLACHAIMEKKIGRSANTIFNKKKLKSNIFM